MKLTITVWIYMPGTIKELPHVNVLVGIMQKKKKKSNLFPG